ncbi:MAG: sugar transferase [Clostridiales bacterium]|nr:sugar transferase [Clostridiales bacterium]
MSELLFGEFHAGTKARIDVERIFENSDCKKLGMRIRSAGSKWIYRIKNAVPAFYNQWKLKRIKGDIVFIQYPITALKTMLSAVIRDIAGKNKIIFLLHDVSYIRYFSQPERKVPEIEFLNLASGLICHNDIMIKKLQEDGVNKPAFTSLELFDYLIDDKAVLPTPIYGNEICFAGNLQKSEFLNQLANSSSIDFTLNLFGPNYEPLNSDHIIYKGSYKPEELVSHLNFSYGLVWDGPDIDTCSGEYGLYTKYNNPHKLSLYIAAGLPVIVWEKAAMAEFVIKNNIGITVDSLLNIDKKISGISEIDYNVMVENVRKFQKNVLSGYYLKTAMGNIINLCQKA